MRRTPTLAELQEEIKQRTRREAFHAGAEGNFMPRYNSLTSVTAQRWFWVGARWRIRQMRRGVRGYRNQ